MNMAWIENCTIASTKQQYLEDPQHRTNKRESDNKYLKRLRLRVKIQAQQLENLEDRVAKERENKKNFPSIRLELKLFYFCVIQINIGDYGKSS